MNNKLFKSVFNNIVILRIIYKHVRLFKLNQSCKFKSRKELLQFKAREYIVNLSIDFSENNEELQFGDLPWVDGILKQVTFDKYTKIQDYSIPESVEIIDFGWYNTEPIKFSTLPSTLHTINNAIIKDNSNDYKIPSNITSISFKECINISGGNNSLFKIPNTIKILKLNSGNWNNQGFKLNKGDIPESVTKLAIDKFEVVELQQDALPNSITNLEILYKGRPSFNFLPKNVKTLYIDAQNEITSTSMLNGFTEITDLSVKFNYIHKIYRDSLPSSITKLSFENVTESIGIGVIPNSVKSLELLVGGNRNLTIYQGSIPSSVTTLLTNQIFNEINTFPPNLIHLDLSHYGYFRWADEKDIIKMISILPQTLISIVLPKSLKHFNFPKHLIIK